jgi:signal transduction histidine kinase
VRRSRSRALLAWADSCGGGGSTATRHARATVVTILLAYQEGLITLDITDNGRGFGTPTRSSGLASMRRRAERNGGTLQITCPSGGGTRLTWTARMRH